MADGTTYTSVGAIRRVRVFSGGGDDTVGYALTGELPASATRSVTMNLGKGNDLSRPTSRPASRPSPGPGHERLRGRRERHVERVRRSGGRGGGGDSSTSTCRGDGGSDAITVDVAGLIQGWVELEIFGGAGTDIIEADATADAGSPGNVYARVKTGAGADMVTLSVNAGGDSFGIVYAGEDDMYEVTDNVFVLLNQENTTRPPVFPDFFPDSAVADGEPADPPRPPPVR